MSSAHVVGIVYPIFLKYEGEYHTRLFMLALMGAA